MSLLAATVLTAIGTAVLAVGAIVTAVFAILAFRKQAQEVTLLQQEAERDREQRFRGQASQVFVWMTASEDSGKPGHAGERDAHARNSSGQPVYDLSASWKDAPQEWERYERAALMPGDEWTFGNPYYDDVVRLRFRDSSGNHWVSTSEGQLTLLARANEARPPLDARLPFSRVSPVLRSWPS